MAIEILQEAVEASSSWQRMDERLIKNKKHREMYKKRCDGLDAIRKGHSLRDASKDHGVDRTTLARATKLAYSKAPNGELYGYRACMPWGIHEIRETTVSAPTSGQAYAMTSLLASCPVVATLLDRYRDTLPSGRFPPSFDILMRRIRAELKDHNLDGFWPMNSPDKGRRAFASYIRRSRIAELADGLPSEPPMDLATAKTLSDLFCLDPFDRVEYDEHEIDADFWVWLFDAKGQLVKIKCRIWVLVLYEVVTGSIVSWKIAIDAFNSLDVTQCFASSLAPWEARTLILPNINYAPGACLPSALAWGGSPQTGRLVAIDNHMSHKVKLPIEAWARHHHGVLNIGKPGNPEARAAIERFFQTFEATVLRLLPGSYVPAKELGQEKTPASEWRAEDHPVHFQAFEDIMDVAATSFNVTGENTTPIDSVVAYQNSPNYWPSPPRSADSAKGMTTIVFTKRFKGSKKKNKPVHIYYQGVRYTAAAICNQYELISHEVQVLVDLEDLRTMTVASQTLKLHIVLQAEKPWHRAKHDINHRKRIRKLVSKRHISLASVECAMQEYAKFTLAHVGSNTQINTQAAQLLYWANNEHISSAATAVPTENVEASTGAPTDRMPDRFAPSKTPQVVFNRIKKLS